MSSSPPLQQRLRQSYQRDEWQNILHFIFPDGSLKLFSTPQALAASQAFVKSTLQIGNIELPDGNIIALLEVETTSQVQLARNRVALRNFVSHFIDEAGASAVMAIFHQEKSKDWRLTYAARQTIIDEDTFEINTVETAPRRFTFLLGEGEPCRTAAERFATLIGKGKNLTLADVEKSFSVEALSKEFFAKYNEHYDQFLAELTSSSRIADTRTRFGIGLEETEEAQSTADKPIRDFAKKLLGRLIFLHFLQKKGWLHGPADTTDWSTGDKDFLRTYLTLAEAAGKRESFHSAYLAPLFFEALNTDRPGQIFPLTGTRMPYLNGGLFDPEPEPLRTLDLPAQLFAELFSFFSEYNFTIDENDPEDHEVGIDPEMLGHIFENLLEDNKDKGAYYTPKVIVSYMCRQSLLRYLESHLGKNEHLTRLCEIHEPGDLREKGNWCGANAKRIATLLEDVKICDPAIGSGAFPIGMLNEIVHLRTLLNNELNDPAERAKLKKSIIQNSIHGVDLDSGAVDIARLRFWLALVVDEETPSPLPNLDYKIMQGNSLLESFQGIDLSQIHAAPDPHVFQLKTILGSPQHEFNLLDEKQTEFREQQKAKQDDLLESTRAYFAARKPERKAQLRAAIDQKVIEHIAHCIAGDLEKTEALADQQAKIAAGKLPKTKGWSEKKSEKTLLALHAAITRLKNVRRQLEQTTRQPERPFFLWHLLFRDVFEQGGFDIVIANPPYVRQELIKEQKPLIEAEGYTTYTGTADLLVYFYERAIQLLKPKGVLTFITSNKFYRAGYGEILRSHLAENLTLHTLIDFRDAPVFNGVIAYASILIGQKEPAPANHSAAALSWDQAKPAAVLPLEIAKAFPVAQSSLTPEAWRLVSPAENKLLTKICSFDGSLKDRNCHVRRGLTTGLNEAFVLTESDVIGLMPLSREEQNIIKPFKKGKSLGRWNIPSENLWCLQIESSNNKKHPWSDSANPWDDFKTTYPKVAEHFESLKEKTDSKGTRLWDRLLNRDDQGHFFWELRSCKYWNEFNLPKITSTKVSKEPTFAIDTSNSLLANTAYFFSPTEDCEVILALFNSKVFHFYALHRFVEKEGGFFEVQPEPLEEFPIPSATVSEKTRLSALATQCAAAVAAGDSATLAAREHEINQLVYRLFHLTPQEIALVESSVGNSPAIKVPASNQGEVYPPAHKSLVWNTVKKLTKKTSYVSLNAVKSELARTSSEKPEDKTLLKALSEAMAEGIVHDAGRGWYSGIVAPAILDDSHIRELADSLSMRFPFLPHYLWSTLQLNPWMHHLSGKGIQFLHIDAEGEQDVADFLRAAGWDVLVNPTAKTANRLVPGPKSLVLRTVRREIDGDSPLTVSTVLVDALLENGRLNFMDEAERKEMSRRLMQEKRIDFAALHSRLKNHKKTIDDLIGDKNSGIISEF